MSDLARLEQLLARSSDPDNPSPEELAALLDRLRTLAVVGASRDPAKPARRVPSYLAAHGLEIIPVNPNAGTILGRLALPDLESVDEPVDLVLLFRPSDQVGPFVRTAADRTEEPAIWLQEGIRDDEAAGEARARGRTVVQDLCLYRAHRCLRENRPDPFAGRTPSAPDPSDRLEDPVGVPLRADPSPGL